MRFNKNILDIDAAAEVERIVIFLRTQVHQTMRKQGGVLGISGGIDSSVVLGLCVRAFGPERVLPLMLPEKDSDPESVQLAERLAAHFGVKPVLEVITPVLDGFGCYPRRDEAIKRVFPEYDAILGYKAKIVLPNNLLEGDTLNVFKVVIVTPDGEEKSHRLAPRDFNQIVAASNFKQRTRMAMLYYHAELHNYAVIGTGNKNEHDQGFFVKYGDGGTDIRPLVHLYKTQVYQLAEYLGIPEDIRRRPPTSDTYSAHSTQEEFFFRLPFHTMDLLWYAQEHGISAEEAAQVMDMEPVQAQRAYADFTRKQRTTEYLRMPMLDLEEISSVT